MMNAESDRIDRRTGPTLLLQSVLVVAVTASLLTCARCAPVRDFQGTFKPGRGVEATSGPGAAPSPDLAALASRIRERYGKADYITFNAEILQHESVAPGFIVMPGKGITPGSVFEVVMSKRGDIRSDLKVNGKPIYTSQIAVDVVENDGGHESSKRFSRREIDHVNKVLTSQRLVDALPSSALSDRVLDHPSWCASGGYVETYVGPEGTFSNSDASWPYSDRIERGTPIRTENIDGHDTLVVRDIQREATPDKKDPNGNIIEGYPAIMFLIFVDPARAVVLGRDVYIQHWGEDPVQIRKVRFTDIRFPADVDDEDAFLRLPEEAKAYRLWSPDDPFPPPASEEKEQSAATK